MSGIKEIRTELKELDKKELQDLLLSVAKYNKEVKGYLVHLLFEKDDISYFISTQKEKLDDYFNASLFSNYKLSKRNLNQIQKYLNQQIKFAKNPVVEVELRGHFLILFRKKCLGKSFSPRLITYFERHYKHVLKAYDKIDEDLQADYRELFTLLDN